jgi:hypothetical protein
LLFTVYWSPVLLQQVRKPCKRLVGHGCLFLIAPFPFSTCLVVQESPVFIVVAVEAKVLPIAPVRRVVLVVVILMVHGKEVKIMAVEFPAAPGTDPGMNSQRLLSVSFKTLILSLPGSSDNAIHLFLVDPFFTRFAGS